eukprot:COSAG04_NODE_1872_length_5345_cov_10.328250_4_plen_257_part_00
MLSISARYAERAARRAHERAARRASRFIGSVAGTFSPEKVKRQEATARDRMVSDVVLRCARKARAASVRAAQGVATSGADVARKAPAAVAAGAGAAASAVFAVLLAVAATLGGDSAFGTAARLVGACCLLVTRERSRSMIWKPKLPRYQKLNRRRCWRSAISRHGDDTANHKPSSRSRGRRRGCPRRWEPSRSKSWRRRRRRPRQPTRARLWGGHAVPEVNENSNNKKSTLFVVLTPVRPLIEPAARGRGCGRGST